MPAKPPRSLDLCRHRIPVVTVSSHHPSEREAKGKHGSRRDSHQVCPLYRDKLRRPCAYSQHRLLPFP